MAESLLPQYWYVVATSDELTNDKVIARQILRESLACYRDVKGRVVIAQDRCIHRCARLSCGTVKNGDLTCGYHGWVYGTEGQVKLIPSETKAIPKLQAKTFTVIEQDGYVYVCLFPGKQTPALPRSMAEFGSDLKGHVRLQNRFKNSLANCVENYIDVPHTAYVHHGVFRKPKGQPIQTIVKRIGDSIHIEYLGETLNLGSFSWFLNPSGKTIVHTDHFYAPNTTHVRYQLPNGYQYTITSQSIPIGPMETMVYTDIYYDFGIWTALSKGFVCRQAQIVIDQDIEILDQQGRAIEEYGELFYDTSADMIHRWTSDIIESLEKGIEPTELEEKEQELVFNV